MRVEQEGDKAITCPDDNSLLGRYFKDRLHIEYGNPITAKDLDAYGRRSITFKKINDELFYMDFSNGIQEDV